MNHVKPVIGSLLCGSYLYGVFHVSVKINFDRDKCYRFNRLCNNISILLYQNPFLFSHNVEQANLSIACSDIQYCYTLPYPILHIENYHFWYRRK